MSGREDHAARKLYGCRSANLANEVGACVETIDRGCCGPDPDRCEFPSFDVRDWASPATKRLWAMTSAGPAEFDEFLGNAREFHAQARL